MSTKRGFAAGGALWVDWGMCVCVCVCVTQPHVSRERCSSWRCIMGRLRDVCVCSSWRCIVGRLGDVCVCVTQPHVSRERCSSWRCIVGRLGDVCVCYTTSHKQREV